MAFSLKYTPQDRKLRIPVLSFFHLRMPLPLSFPLCEEPNKPNSRFHSLNLLSVL